MESKLFKKLFSMLLVVAMVLSMCPTFVFAEGADSDGNDCPECTGEISWIETWTGSEIDGSGHIHYRLKADVTVSANITVESGLDLVIDLAGYSIRSAGSNRCFFVSKGGTLTVIDSKRIEDGKTVDGQIVGASAAQTSAGNIYVDTGAVFKLYDGVITGGTTVKKGTTAYHAGNIYSKGTIYLYGGVVKDGVASNNGGNMAIYGGRTYIYDGVKIYNGKSTGSGGNIYCGTSGALTIYGGEIYGSRTTTNVCLLNNATGTNHYMYGGVIGKDTDTRPEMRIYGTSGKYVSNFYMYGGTVRSVNVTGGATNEVKLYNGVLGEDPSAAGYEGASILADCACYVANEDGTYTIWNYKHKEGVACTDCAYEAALTADAANDSYAITQQEGNHKGSVKDGVTTCDHCGASIECAHTQTQKEAATPATCVEAGYTGDTVCTACGAVTVPGEAIEKLPHSYDANGNCVNGCEGTAGASVTLDGNTSYYSTALEALTTASGTGANVCILKTATVTMKDTFNTTDKALKNVTLSTAEGVTLKDNSGASGGVWYINNVTFAADSNFDVNGYLYIASGSTVNVYGNLTTYMFNCATGTLNVYGDQGGYMRNTGNFFASTSATKYGGHVNVYGDPDSTEPVFVTNEDQEYYQIANYSGTFYVKDAVISIGALVLSNENDDSTVKPSFTAVNSKVIVRNVYGTASTTGDNSIHVRANSGGITLENSTLQLAGTLAVAEGEKVTMSGTSTIITTSDALANVGVVAAESVNGCIKYVDGAYTIVDHTAPDASCTEDGKCTNCGAVINVAPGHTLTETKAEPSSCTKAGHAAYWYCSVCEKYFADADATKVIEDLAAWLAEGGEGYDAIDDHDHQEIVKPENLVSAATCQAAAVYNKSCSVCGEKSEETFSYGEKNAENHVNLKQEAAKAPTCTEDGWFAYEHCDACGHNTYKVDPQTGHTYTYTSNNDKKTHTIGCEKCDYSKAADCADEDGDKFCDLCEQKLIDPKFTVDGVEVETLEEALAAAQNGSVIKLLDNLVLTERLTLDKELTIRMNGYSITGAFEDAYGMIYVKKGATVTFMNGLIENTADIAIGNYGAVIVGTDATVKGYGAGLYNFYFAADYYGVARVNGKVNEIWNCGELVISEYGVVEYLDNSGYATVYGTVNELYARDGSDAPDVYNGGLLIISDVAKVTTLSIPEDYKLVEVEPYVYKVVAKVYAAEVNGQKYETFAEAFAQGGEIKLLADLELTERLTIASNITLDLNSFAISGAFEDAYGMIYVRKGAELTVKGGTVANEGGIAIGNYGVVTIAADATVIGAEEYAAIYNFYFAADYYGTAVVNGKANIIWNCGELTIGADAVVEYLDNSGYAAINGTVNEIFAQDGSDCAGVANAGILAITDTSKVTLDEGFVLWQIAENTYKVHAHAHENVGYTDPTIEADGFWTYKCSCGDSYTVIDENTRIHVNVPAVDAEDIKDKIETEDTEATTEDIQEVIDNVIHGNDAVVDKDIFVDEKNDKVIEQMKQEKPELADKEPVLHITLQGIGVKTESGALVATKLVFDVTPMLGDTKIENLAAPLTFHLPVDNSLTGNAYVYHEGEFMGVYAIVSEGGNNYVVVSSQDFSEFTVEVQNESDVAINTTTKVIYTELQAALNAAAKGETVKLLKAVTAEDIYVGAGKTLDLNGFALTVTSSFSASFTTTHVIDSSNGEGLLVVAGADVALNESNKQLPVWTAAGVKFVEIVYKQIIQAVPGDADAKKFRFYFNVADESILPTLLKEDCITIRVKVNYTTASGLNAYQYFELTDSLIEQYVNKWPNKTFDLTLKGVTGLSGLSFTAEIVSTAPSGLSVVKSSSTCPV